MARKQKRKPAAARARSRPAAPLPPPPATGPGAGQSRPAARVGGDQALVRSVEMSLGGTPQIRGKGKNRFVLDGIEPGIPLDRVPYFVTDLRRIAIIGGLMVILLILAAYLIIPFAVR